MVDIKLTAKQQKFADNYIETGNAAKSAVNAGYSKKTTAVIGAENVLKPNIKSYIDECDENFCNAFNEFTKIQRKYMPFYDDSIIKETNNVIEQMLKLRVFFRYKYVDVSMRSFVDKHFDEVIDIHNYLDIETRYISSMIKKIFSFHLEDNNYSK
ncbi:MAG: terminase small subunit [Rickettsia endosymbiont of Ixodes persulcatus]|nr:terminase small subunit [Rickettsia endosymbiont of Ixodes persulcatus]